MKSKVFWAAFIIIYLISSWWKENRPQNITSKTEIPEATVSAQVETNTVSSSGRNFYKVIKVVDGDTIQVEGGGKKETIRVIGINAPESVDPKQKAQCFGIEASNKAKEMLVGKEVFLEVDETQGDRDKYDRELRYIFLADGTNFSKIMIENGFAREYTYRSKKYKYQAEFKQAQIEARESKRGLWGECK